MITQTLLQLTSAVASIGRVKTSSHITSRRFNALALGAVAADFAIKYSYTGRADFLVGLAYGVRGPDGTDAPDLWLLQEIEENTLTLLPLMGVRLGCLGEASDMCLGEPIRLHPADCLP